MKSWLPILRWLPDYQVAWLPADLMAGANVWAVLIPLALAYAGIVGVEPIVGLYTVPLAMLGYALFGGSRQFVVGPDAAVAVLSGGVIAVVAVNGDEYLSLTLALALIVGVLYALCFILKMGWIADLIPEPVIKGFIEGVVWVTIVKQLPALLGLELATSPEGFFGRTAQLVAALPTLHVPTAAVGGASLAALLLLRRFAPRAPGALLVLVAAIALVALLGLDGAGVAVLGKIEADMAFALPTGLTLEQIVALAPGALAIVVLGYTKSLGPLKRAAEHSGEQFDPDQELLAIGAANVAAGLGGYPVAGSLTATAVSIDAGSKTQIASLSAGVLSVLTIMFLLPLMADLALTSLAAIIIVTLAGLSDLGYFRKLWRLRRIESAIGASALLGVLLFDVMTGVVIGVVLALFTLAYHIHKPTTAIVGRIPSGAFVDVDEHPAARQIPGMLIWRQYAPLVFLNARGLANQLRGLAQGREDLRVVVVDATASSGIDSSAAHALVAARKDLGAANIDVWVVNPRRKGWTLLVAELEATGAPLPPVFDSLSDAVIHFEQAAGDRTAGVRQSTRRDST